MLKKAVHGIKNHLYGQVVKVTSVRNMGEALDHHIAVGTFDHGMHSSGITLSRCGCDSAGNVRHSRVLCPGFCAFVCSQSLRDRNGLLRSKRRLDMPWSAGQWLNRAPRLPKCSYGLLHFAVPTLMWAPSLVCQ
jgi:hypothetical protein